MKAVLIFLLIVLSGQVSLASRCSPLGKFRFIEKQKKVTQAFAYCFDESKNQLLSQSCEKKCTAKEKRFLPGSLEFLDRQDGDPLFTYCYLFKGTPMMVEFLWDQEWRETSICMFEDKSFVNLSYLFDQITFVSIRNPSAKGM